MRGLPALAGAREGAVAVIFSLAAPIVLIVVASAVDYFNVINARSNLQNLADRAALAGAQSSRLGVATQASVSSTVSNIVASGAPGAAVTSTTAFTPGSSAAAAPAPKATAAVAMAAAATATTPTTAASGGTTNSVSVKLGQTIQTKFGGLFGLGSIKINASATARASGGSPLCLASLATSDPKLFSSPSSSVDPAGTAMVAAIAATVTNQANPGIQMTKGATTTAPGCIVTTNMPTSNSLDVEDTSSLTAALIQSGGGYLGAVGANYSVAPSTDHPPAPDPLGKVPAPSVGSCAFNALVVNGGAPALGPGVYCGGLHITGGANVTFLPGIYVIKDGSFVVDGASTISGNGVGFYLTATKPATAAKMPMIFFGTDTHVSLMAPLSGSMAGFLFFEDRALPMGAIHAIVSNDASVLHGTLYISRGYLAVAATQPVALKSTWTIIVANALVVTGGPQLVLNSAYTASPVPVPLGVGPNNGTTVSLAK